MVITGNYRWIKLSVATCAAGILTLISASLPSPAHAKDDAIIQKAALYGIYSTCYRSNNMVTPVYSDEFRDIWSITKDTGNFTLPTGWYDEFSISCPQLIENTAANASFPGIASMNGVVVPSGGSGIATIGAFLEDMGYTKFPGGKGQCASFTYTHDNGGDPDITTLCAPTTDDGVIMSDQVTVSYSDGAGIAIQLELDTPGEIDLDCNTNGPTHGGCSTHKFVAHETKFADLVGRIYKDLQEHRSVAVCDPFSLGKKCWRLQPGAPVVDRSEAKSSFKIGSSTTAANKAIKYLSKGTYKKYTDLKLSKSEQIALLQDYLQNYYRVEIYGCNISGNDVEVASSAGYSKVLTSLKSSNGGFQECWVRPTQHSGSSVAAYNSDFFFDGTMMGFGDVTKALTEAAKDQETDNTVVKPTEGGVVGTDEENEGQESNICSTAAASLGWIICPVIQGIGIATDWMYEYVEQEFLVADADFVATTKKDANGNEVHTGTYIAWTSFRDFTNIIFAIVLAVVILSQITGFGVSNYGIKKILPALIVVAILVNISFFLCQLAVDVSNVAGYGIKKIFIELGGPSSEFGEGSLGDIIGSTDGGSGILGGLLGTGGVAAVIATTPKWIWPFLVLLIGATISVMFFFLLLGIRQAGIIILVALSPVAIVCYALPNTKSIFSRWWKMFFGLLLVYPICGALMGGGQFASKLLLANVNENTGFFYVLVAMLIQTVPFFFVPSILKSSMAAMGNIGMKVSNFGRGLNRGTTKMIQKSDGYRYRVAKTQAKSANRTLKRQTWRDIHGLSVRERASRWAGRGGVRGAIGDAAASSRNRSREWRINAVARQKDVERRAQMTAAGGLAGAERRQNEELRKFHENTYRGDRTFMSDLDAQELEYEKALEAVDRDPTNEAEVARLRALQDVVGSTPDGQDRIQRVINRRLYNAQEAARSAGLPPVLSAGMQAAKETLMSDHGGFKSGNRGLAATLKDMNANGDVFKRGNFEKIGEVNGRKIYGNTYYGSQAVNGSAAELANANDDTLSNLLYSVQNGNMSTEKLESIYRNASEAITNDNISVKQGTETYLNDIRRAAYAKMQADFTSSYVNHGEYVDDKGRTYTYLGTNNNGDAEYQRDGSSKIYTFDGTDFMDNKTGKILDGRRFSQSATAMFKAKYGDYQDLHPGMKIKH